METNKLRYFVVLAKTGNIRRASEILNLTPSALSKTIKQLEEELEVNLITPMGRGITLTNEGTAFARQVEIILGDLHDLKDQIQNSKKIQKEAPLKIATFEVFSTYFLDGLQDAKLEDRKIALHEVIPGELEQVLEAGKVDYGITYMPIPNPNLEHVKICRLLMGVYKKKGSFEEMDQENLPFVVPVYPLSGVPTRIRGLDGWPDSAYTRKVKYEVTLMESALELCRQGLCAGYFPSFVVEKHNRKHRDAFNLVRHPWSGSTQRCFNDVYLVKRKDRPEDSDMKKIAKMIRLGTRASSENS